MPKYHEPFLYVEIIFAIKVCFKQNPYCIEPCGSNVEVLRIAARGPSPNCEGFQSSLCKGNQIGPRSFTDLACKPIKALDFRSLSAYPEHCLNSRYFDQPKNYCFFTRALFRFSLNKIAPLNYFAVVILELRGGFFFKVVFFLKHDFTYLNSKQRQTYILM